jgi:hypothetical protein
MSWPRAAVAIAKDTTGMVETIRQLRIAHEDAVKARSAALNALTGLAVTAPDQLRRQLELRKSTRGRATLCARLCRDYARLHEPVRVAKAALRSLERRVTDLNAEMARLIAISSGLSPPRRRSRPRAWRCRPGTPAPCGARVEVGARLLG